MGSVSEAARRTQSEMRYFREFSGRGVFSYCCCLFPDRRRPAARARPRRPALQRPHELMAAGNHPAGPPPKEAVDYLRRKGVRTGYDYREVWREEHAVAFTVANMMKVSMLTDVQRYAQYVAWRSGDETMLGQIEQIALSVSVVQTMR